MNWRVPVVVLGLLSAVSVSAQPLLPPAQPSGAPTAQPAPQPSAKPEAPPENPHGGQPNPHAANPHGGGGQPTEIPLPQDGAQPAPDLNAGTIQVSLRDANERPLPNTPFEIAVLHQSISRGDSKEKLTGITDENGLATFENLEFGTAHVYRVIGRRGEASFNTGDFNLGDKFGMRAHLHLYESTPNMDEAGVLGKVNVSVTLKEEVLVFEYQVSYLNRSPIAWVANTSFPMPEGFKAFNTPDGMSPKLAAGDSEVTIVGTVPPGETQIAYRFHVPLETDGTQVVVMPLPPNMAAVGLAVEASQKMDVRLAGFPKVERKSDAAGKSFLITKKQISPEEYMAQRFLTPTALTITGLPSRPWASFLAAGIAFFAAVAGVVYLAVRRKAGLSEEAKEDLAEARETLLAEFELLEAARARGDIGPKTYEKIREAMLDALAGIMERQPAGRRWRTPAPEPVGVADVGASFEPLTDIDKRKESSSDTESLRSGRPQRKRRPR